MIAVSRVPNCPTFQKTQVRGTFWIVGQQEVSREGKSAGQSTCPASPSLKGVCGCEVEPHHTPLRGAANPGTTLRIVASDLPEPTDEELWLEDVARQVEDVARPLFAAAWVELLRRALDSDDNELGEPA